jgi:hypothetical protein
MPYPLKVIFLKPFFSQIFSHIFAYFGTNPVLIPKSAHPPVLQSNNVLKKFDQIIYEYSTIIVFHFTYEIQTSKCPQKNDEAMKWQKWNLIARQQHNIITW